MEARGEARRMADAFAEGDVETVSTHLQSVLHSHRRTLQTLESFLHDNQQLTKLVQDLPNKVSHSIMVPFGKAAFFPGRLIHTNEFLVLLGEGYYAECSASKTLDILGRRGKFLGSQIAGVNSQLADLDVESCFFSETLAEAAAGYVEIREEFVESLSSSSASNLGMSPLKVPGTDGASSISTSKEILSEANKRSSSNEEKEHELLMARLDELEAAEAAANWDLSLKENNPKSRGDIAEFQSPVQDHDQFVTNARQRRTDDGIRLEAFRANGPDQGALSIDCSEVEESANFHGGSLKGCPSLQSPGDLLKFEEWRRCTSNEVNLNQRSEVRRKTSNLPTQNQEARQSEETFRLLNQVAPFSQTGTQRINKAFTGTVLERSGSSLPTEHSQATQQITKRPTSKFKMRQTDM